MSLLPGVSGHYSYDAKISQVVHGQPIILHSYNQIDSPCGFELTGGVSVGAVVSSVFT